MQFIDLHLHICLLSSSYTILMQLFYVFGKQVMIPGFISREGHVVSYIKTNNNICTGNYHKSISHLTWSIFICNYLQFGHLLSYKSEIFTAR